MQLKNIDLDKNSFLRKGFGAFAAQNPEASISIGDLWKVPRGFDIDVLIKVKAQEAWEKGREFGIKESKQKARTEEKGRIRKYVAKEVQDYVSMVTKVSDYTKKMAVETIKDGFNIKEIRTKFDLINRDINLLFVIDTKPENETAFANVIINVRKEILHKKDYIANLWYINIQNGKTDNALISQDFPAKRIRRSNVR